MQIGLKLDWSTLRHYEEIYYLGLSKNESIGLSTFAGEFVGNCFGYDSCEMKGSFVDFGYLHSCLCGENG
jgi:hypothetical protein